MNVKDVLQTWLNENVENLGYLLWETSPELWQWQPTLYRYSIALTIWHILRDLDVLATQILQDKVPDEEIWCQQSPTYNPHGKGHKGLGTMVGYSDEELAEMPAFTPIQLQAYLKDIQTDLTDWLTQSPHADLHESISFSGSRPYPTHTWIYNKLRHMEAHLREIAGIQKIWQMNNETSSE